jgi:hypothetical protein
VREAGLRSAARLPPSTLVRPGREGFLRDVRASVAALAGAERLGPLFSRAGWSINERSLTLDVLAGEGF